jgi:hypothetical protein
MATLPGMPAILLVPLLLLASCVTAEPEQLPQPPPNVRLAGPSPTPTQIEPVLVQGLSISAVTVNQGVQIEVMNSFDVVQGRAPIVPGKDALIRAHVAPHQDWEPRAIRGVLTVHSPDRSWVFEETLQVDEPSFDGDLLTTLDGIVPAEYMEPGLSLQVRFYEVDGVLRTASEGRTAWPVEGAQELPFATWGGRVPVRLIPVVYAADGSNRVADTSPEQMDLLIGYLSQMYPTTDWAFTIEDELVWEEEISPTGGLNGLLDRIVDLREEMLIPANEYLYAIVSPSETRSGFCATGCTAGLSYRPDNPNRAWMRSSVSLGFPGERTAETMAHELGHAHGRRHAPCGNAAQIDPAYPYEGGLLGSWGWDGVDLIAPGSTGDIMGYCAPKWISDYQVAGLYERVAAMQGLYVDEARDGEIVRWVAEDEVGVLRDRGTRARVLEGGEEVTIKVAVDGETVGVTAHYYGLDDGPGGAWLLPDVGGTVATWPDGRSVRME